jgi:hypothetical protein
LGCKLNSGENSTRNHFPKPVSYLSIVLVLQKHHHGVVGSFGIYNLHHIKVMY